jgi:hypothetical protein
MASGEPASEAELRARLELVVRASPILMQVLTTLRDFALPDWRIASGSVFQTVWNSLTGRDPDYGIHDYDVLYFDPDTSWDAEDAVIRRIAAAFAPGLSEKVEVRNQARVHLWFEQKFGEPYTPLSSTDEALGRFLSPANAVGIRLEPDGRIDITAPLGLADCFALRIRPNPLRVRMQPNYLRVAAGLKARWPELTVEPPEA